MKPLYRRILVPLDGTPVSEQALAYAIAIASRAGAVVHLVTVEIPPPATIPRVEWEEDLRDLAHRYLTSIAERFEAAGVPGVEVEVLKGEAADALKRYGEEVGADLTVLATHGRGPVKRAWLGSVADRFVRSTTAPVLLVRADESAQPAALQDLELRRILMTVDGSPLSEWVLDPATELGRLFGAEYTLLRLIEYPHDLKSVYLPDTVEANRDFLDDQARDARAELEELCERIGANGELEVTPETHVVARVPDGILDIARERGADVIAMTSHGYGGVKRMVLGSVADKVLRGAECAVLVVHPRSE
jgi:nucleotide-binding universal stress UspA family protein